MFDMKMCKVRFALDVYAFNMPSIVHRSLDKSPWAHRLGITEKKTNRDS